MSGTIALECFIRMTRRNTDVRSYLTVAGRTTCLDGASFEAFSLEFSETAIDNESIDGTLLNNERDRRKLWLDL